MHRFQQSGLVDQAGAGGVDQDGARLHRREIGGGQGVARAFRQHEMQADRIGAGQQFGLVDQYRTGGSGLLGGEVRAPRQYLHVQRLAVARHPAAELTQPDQAESQPTELHARGQALLESPGANLAIAERQLSGGREQQGQCEFGGGEGRRAAGGVADQYATGGAGVDVDGGVARAGEAQQPKPGQAGDQAGRKRRPLAHRDHRVERLQRVGGGVLVGEGILEEHQVGGVGNGGPITQVARHVLPIVEHSHSCHVVPPAAPCGGGGEDARRGKWTKSPWSAAG